MDTDGTNPAAGALAGGAIGGPAGAVAGAAIGLAIGVAAGEILFSKTPNAGDPGSIHDNPGSGQIRKYGPDGKPEWDIDTDHDHGQNDEGGAHGHNWENGNRGKGYPICLIPPCG